MKSALDDAVAALREELGENLYSCCLYGSAVRGNSVEGVSDINLLIVLNTSDSAAHERVAHAIGDNARIDPFVLARRGFERSVRAFAAKFASIKRNYRRLRWVMIIGVGYRRELEEWIATRPVDCLEIIAEHFYGRNESVLSELSRQFLLFVHGLGLSLGTSGELDPERLSRFARVVGIAQPEWISEHIAFTRTAEVDLGHLNPVQPTGAMARTIAAHAREVAERCGRPIILENITSHLRLERRTIRNGFSQLDLREGGLRFAARRDEPVHQ